MPTSKLGKINLLPKDSFEFSTLGKVMSWSLKTGRVMVVLTEFVVILAFGSRFYYDKKLNDLTEVIDQKQAVVDSYAEIEAKFRDILSKQTIIENYLTKKIDLDDLISRVSKITPTDVVFSDISIKDNSYSLIGSSGSEGGIANLLAGINTLPNVNSVSVGAIDFDQRQGVITFKITVNIGGGKT